MIFGVKVPKEQNVIITGTEDAFQLLELFRFLKNRSLYLSIELSLDINSILSHVGTQLNFTELHFLSKFS